MQDGQYNPVAWLLLTASEGAVKRLFSRLVYVSDGCARKDVYRNRNSFAIYAVAKCSLLPWHDANNFFNFRLADASGGRKSIAEKL